MNWLDVKSFFHDQINFIRSVIICVVSLSHFQNAGPLPSGCKSLQCNFTSWAQQDQNSASDRWHKDSVILLWKVVFPREATHLCQFGQGKRLCSMRKIVDFNIRPSVIPFWIPLQWWCFLTESSHPSAPVSENKIVIHGHKPRTGSILSKYSRAIMPCFYTREENLPDTLVHMKKKSMQSVLWR